MSNHYHLLLRTNEEPLGIFMRKLNGTYAQYFRRKYKKNGYVFQDRDKSIVTQDQWYFEQLIGYVHLNPIRAKMCTNLNEFDIYPWTGHSVLVGKQKTRFQDTKSVLRQFVTSKDTGVQGYHR